jgi:hypothetical protein
MGVGRVTDPVAEAENFLRSFRQPDFVYKHTDYIECDGPGFSDWVAVSTFGSTEDLAAQNDEPETHPIRVRVHSDDGDEAEAYMTLDEAKELLNALRRGIRKAEGFEQPS